MVWLLFQVSCSLTEPEGGTIQLAAAGRTLARKGGCGSPKPKKVCVHGGWGEVPKVGAGLVGEELGAW
jgi:hypothetical protein